VGQTVTPESILEFANDYRRELEVDALDLYRLLRGPCEERLEEISYQKNRAAITPKYLWHQKTLQATEALAYAFYFEHGRPIDGDESEFRKHLSGLWPDYAPPRTIAFGSGANDIELDDYQLELPLGSNDHKVILAVLRAKFPAYASWLQDWLFDEER